MIKGTWIKIDRDVLENTEFDTLVFLFGILSYDPINTGFNKANFFINGAIENLENFNKLSDSYKKLLELNFEDQVNNSINYRIVSNHKGENKKFLIQEAIRFFQTPISIILENSLNDGYFLKAIFKHFEPTRRLITFYNNGWIQFENAGGYTNIQNYIDGRLQALKIFSEENNSQPKKYLRCFVMMDSDKTSKDSPWGKKKESLKAFLEENNSMVHILSKRAMENYLPDNAIQKLNSHNYEDQEREMTQWKNNLQTKIWINDYLALSNEEKDYKYFSELGMPFAKREMPKFFGYNDFTDKQGLLEREGGTVDKNEFLEIITKIGSLL
ncbi:MAG: hypothetical protein IPM42_18540 [Saprospiraceae bacterium]|nr:hypothetical protein [Saprospiraceae bacterium]